MSEVSIPTTPIVYPDSDGQPMADNTEQFRWIVMIKENLEVLFADRADVFVAGDLLWYPVEGRPDICRAPDALVVFGRPKGRRGSYIQFREGGIAPQVVFEVLSPGNDQAALASKFEFYDTYGVEEYYLYDPDSDTVYGWLRSDGRLQGIAAMDGWVSPRLGVRFDLSGSELRLFYPDGQPFVSLLELRRRVEQAESRAEQAESRAERLAAQLRALGINPADL